MAAGRKRWIMGKALLMRLVFLSNQIGFAIIEISDNIRQGLHQVGFSETEVQMIMGGNWMRFYRRILALSQKRSDHVRKRIIISKPSRENAIALCKRCDAS